MAFRTIGTMAWIVGLLVAAGGCGRAGEYPARPITLICPWSAGGGTDRVARQLAMQLEWQLGVPVNVINATGGGGVTGHTRGATAPADGYTLTLATAELNILHWRGMTSVGPDDFAPVAMINHDSAAIFVRSDAPWRSLDDLKAAIRDAPRPLRASGTAYGGVWHLAFAGWLEQQSLGAGAAVWVSINGATPSLQELIAGGVEVVCCSLPEAESLLEAGQVRSLGVMAAERLPTYPDVPTLIEQGDDWQLGTWRALLAPAGTPPQRIERLVEATAAAASSESFVAFMDSSGFAIELLPPARTRQAMGEADTRFGGVIETMMFSTLDQQRVGPMAFPTLLAVLLVAASGLIAWEWRRNARGTAAVAQEPIGTRPVAVLLAIVAFMLAAPTVGFILAGAAVLAALWWVMGWRRAAVAPAAAVLACAVYQVFGVFLRVPLPRGWIGW